MAKTKEITPTEYAKHRKCSVSNITKHIRNGNQLPFVVRVNKYSRFYTLEVPKNFGEE